MYKIDVTQEDIDRAVRNTSTHCAVAEAIYRQIPGVRHVTVDAQTIRFTRPELKTRYFFLTPTKVQDYVIAFDAGDAIKPLTFRLYQQAYDKPAQRDRAPEGGNLYIQYGKDSDKTKTTTRGVKKIPNVRTPASLERRTGERKFGQRVMRVNSGKSK